MLKYQYLTRHLYSIYPAAFDIAAFLVILHRTLGNGEKGALRSVGRPSGLRTRTHAYIRTSLF